VLECLLPHTTGNAPAGQICRMSGENPYIRLSGSVQVLELACTGGHPQLVELETGYTSYPSAWPSAATPKLPPGYFSSRR
jgi:hypothetical protein